MERIFNIQNVKSIEQRAFAGTNIESFTIPNGVNCIPEYAFTRTYSLKSVACHDGVRFVQSNAFKSSGIEKFDWPLSCKEIPDFCFQDCQSLSDLSVCDGLTSVGQYAFSGSGISHFDWPKTCDKIPSGCFYNSKLKNMVIPPNVKDIGKYAFANCHELDCVDLTSLVFCCCDKEAFSYSEKAEISMPYYDCLLMK